MRAGQVVNNTTMHNKKQYKQWRDENKDRIREYDRRSLEKLRREVLTHYGNGRIACVGCGFNDIRALSIDHIDGNGHQDRQRKGYGKNFYYWLRTHSYPEGYQTLCMNCQFIKAKTNGEFSKRV